MNDAGRQVPGHTRPRPKPRHPAPPLSGRLVAESRDTISVRVAEGIWTLDRDDVLQLRDESPDSGTVERAVLVWIRPGATADFTQRRRIQLTERPLTLPPRPSPAVGDELLARLTEQWARKLDVAPAPGAAGATVSYSQTRSGGGSDDGIACDSLD
ncbi:hypothetical protein J2W56_000273 [Nocardia kruczakiae]|uniref:Uncharacterized protein n=1 Tax=Nocardia kruczakiae TaxID=261477 RepID=A0ABU1X7Q0_9NOCA|nr:hypothetical protein [Nocardia kruczakiae]MDR7166555.1 hypothetical protein [Nocardia kruczakiae]